MVTYTCPRCGYQASQLSHYKNHLNKRVMCEGTASLVKEYVKYDIDLEERLTSCFNEIKKVKSNIITLETGEVEKEEEKISNYIIYKISCKDENIKNLYVGSTVNFYNRQYQHTKSCFNVKDRSYNNRLYTFIRSHGGFDNWEFGILECLECDKKTAELKEEFYRKSLNADLNSKVVVNV